MVTRNTRFPDNSLLFPVPVSQTLPHIHQQIPHQVICPLGTLTPLIALWQPFIEVVVGEQSSVVEQGFRPLGDGVGGEELVILGV